ncbi:DMT family transporter [Salinibacterium sp. ZJ70]|uniref:DMT family transporter n=1 Tax=Salinibacterium sp. ZJ70 TaxID=2708084 RepID=UPI0014211907|nr:EamA family transporter [Salinibacterium sp. ZJ70]
MGTGRPRAVAAVAGASLLWGTTGTVASFLPDEVSPLAIGAATMGIGGLLLFAFAARPALGVLRDPGARRWVLAGAVGVVVYPLAFYTGMDLAGVAIGNVVALGSGPIVTAVLEWVFERRRLTVRWGVATALALGGMVLLTLGTHAGPAARSGGVVAGVLVGLLAGIAYGLFTYASSRGISTGHGSRGVMGAMFGVGGLLLVPVLVATGAPLVDDARSLGMLAYLALGPMFLAYLLIGAALRTLRSSMVATIALLEPVVATTLAVVIVGERLDALGWTGMAAILVGIVILVAALPPSLRSRARLDFRV